MAADKSAVAESFGVVYLSGGGEGEQTRVQGSRKPLVGERGNALNGAAQTLQNSSICKINLWPVLVSYKFFVLLFV